MGKVTWRRVRASLTAFNRYSTSSLAPSVAECVDRDLKSFSAWENFRASSVRCAVVLPHDVRHQVDSAHSARIGKCAIVSDLSSRFALAWAALNLVTAPCPPTSLHSALESFNALLADSNET